jgi:hypothetical protein
VTWEYRFSVIEIAAWPSRSCTILGCAPCAMGRVIHPAPRRSECSSYQAFRALECDSVTDSITSDWERRRYDTLVNAASSVSAACRRMSGMTRLERFSIIAIPGTVRKPSAVGEGFGDGNHFELRISCELPGTVFPVSMRGYGSTHYLHFA